MKDSRDKNIVSSYSSSVVVYLSECVLVCWSSSYRHTQNNTAQKHTNRMLNFFRLMYFSSPLSILNLSANTLSVCVCVRVHSHSVRFISVMFLN